MNTSHRDWLWLLLRLAAALVIVIEVLGQLLPKAGGVPPMSPLRRRTASKGGRWWAAGRRWLLTAAVASGDLLGFTPPLYLPQKQRAAICRRCIGQSSRAS